MVLVMMDFHRLGIDVRLKRIKRIGQRRQHDASRGFGPKPIGQHRRTGGQSADAEKMTTSEG